MRRKIITIDQEKCNGCGLCLPNCPEGAIQVIDGKARLVSDLLCDGLGACMGYCPEGAITIEEREAESYDEAKVLAQIIPQGLNTIRAHLKHLKEHGEIGYYRQALQILQEHRIVVQGEPVFSGGGGCPGSRSQSFQVHALNHEPAGRQPSQLTHWPIQLHLISPSAGHFRHSDLLVAADCTAFTLGHFHQTYLAGKTLIIACPKLDTQQEVYLEKIKALIDEAAVNTITVLIMQVPCCGGLLRLVQAAAGQCQRKASIQVIVIDIKGEELRNEWL
ncbi:MAG TPA: 4Fe-4S binding protein [bacterium]|nr:4Fe-4S binding protein [bacterium]